LNEGKGSRAAEIVDPVLRDPIGRFDRLTHRPNLGSTRLGIGAGADEQDNESSRIESQEQPMQMRSLLHIMMVIAFLVSTDLWADVRADPTGLWQTFDESGVLQSTVSVEIKVKNCLATL